MKDYKYDKVDLVVDEAVAEDSSVLSYDNEKQKNNNDNTNKTISSSWSLGDGCTTSSSSCHHPFHQQPPAIAMFLPKYCVLLFMIVGMTILSGVVVPPWATDDHPVVTKNQKKKIPLPTNVSSASRYPVALSNDGRQFVMALPSEEPGRMEIYSLQQQQQQDNKNNNDNHNNDDSSWTYHLLQSGVTDVHSLIVASEAMDPEGQPVAIYWADQQLTVQALTSPPRMMGAQAPFPNDAYWPVHKRKFGWPYYHSDKKIVASPTGSHLILHEKTLVLGVYQQRADAIYERVGEIPCEAFEQDSSEHGVCTEDIGADDTYAVLSYGFLIDDASSEKHSSRMKIGVNLCTMVRCSIHVFQQRPLSSTTNYHHPHDEDDTTNEEWEPVANFRRDASTGDIVFFGTQDHPMMLQAHVDPRNQSLVLQTWNKAAWSTGNTTTTILPIHLPHHHPSQQASSSYYWSLESPQVSNHGHACFVLVDTAIDHHKRQMNERLAAAWVARWNPSLTSWNVTAQIDLTPFDPVQVRMSGNGQRLLIFQKDWTFQVYDL